MSDSVAYKNFFPRSKSSEKNNVLMPDTFQSSVKIHANLVLNYVATIKGHFRDIKKAKDLVNKNKLKEYDNKHRPIFLRIISKDASNQLELFCRRINSTTDKCIKVKDIEGDEKNPNYIYIVSMDNLEENRSRTHIFNLIDKNMIEIIRKDWASFGDSMDKLIMNYTIPDETESIVKLIQINCLSQRGQFVNRMKKTMSLPLQHIFAKKGLINTNSTLLSSKRYSNKSSALANMSSTGPILRNSKPRRLIRHMMDREKSKSIENLLVGNSEMYDLLFSHNTPKQSDHQQLQQDLLSFNNNTSYNTNSPIVTNLKSGMKKSASQMSLNDKQYKAIDLDTTTDSTGFADSAWFYKFENVISNSIGRAHLKNFLKEEVSSENIDFWQAVSEFSTIEDGDEKLVPEAQRIYYFYIHNTSDTPVNLEYHTVETVRERLNNKPTNTMFNEAQSHVYNLMKSDSFNRFLLSKHFIKWKEEMLDLTSPMKPSVSTSSLNQHNKRRSFLPAFLKVSRSKLSRDGSRKSSAQTLDSDGLSGSHNTNSCKISLMMENNMQRSSTSSNIDCARSFNVQCEVHYVSERPHRKLVQVIKKLNKRFSEGQYTAYNECDNKIVPYYEILLNLLGQRIIVEPTCVIRVGLVQDSLDTIIYENIWFVVRPRSSICLSSALDCIVKKFQHELEQYVVVNEKCPDIVLEWQETAYSFDKCSLLLIEKLLFKKAKFYGKPLPDIHSNLWKKVLKDDTFLNSLNCDEDNAIDSRDAFQKFNLEPRRVGYISSKSLESSELTKTTDQFRFKPSNTFHTDYDNQRGVFTEDQLELPDFLKKEIDKSSNIDNTNVIKTEINKNEGKAKEEEECNSDIDMVSSWNSSSMKRYSSINYGGDSSDLSFSELDDLSIPSPSKYELISDFE